jgi:arylsulfatase A-like enzyme
MDSCRFDSFVAAKTPNIDKLGEVQKRYSYASWTAPSHQTFSMGLLPHKNPPYILASDVYKDEYKEWEIRTGLEGFDFKRFLPHLSLPKVLNDMGYNTYARVSMPVLNPSTSFARDFDDYKLMANHNLFSNMVEEINLPEDEDESNYYFLNLGETHYPFMLEDETLPIISGVHGVVKKMNDVPVIQMPWEEFVTPDKMKMLHNAQIKSVEYIDNLIAKIFEKCAKERTHFIITADHGELFGEDGFFGHGPIMHEKVFEVPFIEGMLK